MAASPTSWTTRRPQLGGDLDANGHNIGFDNGTGITDDAGNEQIVFHKTASAVNQVGVTNAATGNAPQIAAEGGDTNIDLTLAGKGTGHPKAALFGVNAGADTTTRFAVAAAASLFNHAGAGHQHKINKNAAGDTASLLFQTGFSGRAEMGTTGDDDFHFKVSADGSAWNEAIVVDRSTGRVSLPATPELATLTFVIDGGGAAIATGIKGDLEIPFACTINQVTLLADQSGSIVVDIWKDTYANYPPTGADSITASAKPTISAAAKSQDATLTGWTTVDRGRRHPALQRRQRHRDPALHGGAQGDEELTYARHRRLHQLLYCRLTEPIDGRRTAMAHQSHAGDLRQYRDQWSQLEQRASLQAARERLHQRRLCLDTAQSRNHVHVEAVPVHCSAVQRG